MKIVEPKVFLIGETRLCDEGLAAYLAHIGAPTWKTDAPSDAELITEVMSRGCYKSFIDSEGKPLNPNITKVREGNAVHLLNLIMKQHGSVFEHVQVNFMICDVDRVFTHELVTHRVGMAKSQESQRYVRQGEIGFHMQGDLEVLSTKWGVLTMEDVEEGRAIMFETVEYVEGQMKRLNELWHLDDTKSFEIKKRLTSIIRRIAPEGGTTNIGYSANIRTLRHLLELRTSPAAEYEIREVFAGVGEIVMRRYPNMFADYEVIEEDGLPCYQTVNRKI